jgi:hypothetical protein
MTMALVPADNDKYEVLEVIGKLLPSLIELFSPANHYQVEELSASFAKCDGRMTAMYVTPLIRSHGPSGVY